MKISDNFRIRCSSIHRIAAEGKQAGLTSAEQKEYDDLLLCKKQKLLTATGKVARFTDNRKTRLQELESLKGRPAELPTGAKTYAHDWLQNYIYQRTGSFSSEQTTKGNRTEDEAFEMIKEHLSDPFLRSHPDRVVCDYIEGQCDLIGPNIVIDAKAAFDHTTMPILSSEVKREHWCQLQGYGYLYERKKLALAYVLTDLPIDMVEKKARYEVIGKYGPDYSNSEYQEAFVRISKALTYSDVPNALRVDVKRFDYEYAFIDFIIDRVKQIRAYIDVIVANLPAHVKACLDARR